MPAFNPSQHRHDQSKSRKVATFEFSWKWHISKKLKKQHRRFQAKKEPIFLLTRLFELSFPKKVHDFGNINRRQSTNNLITNRSIEIDHSRIWLCRKTSICELGNKRYIKEVISVVPLDKISKPKRVYPIITSPKILIYTSAELYLSLCFHYQHRQATNSKNTKSKICIWIDYLYISGSPHLTEDISSINKIRDLSF